MLFFGLPGKETSGAAKWFGLAIRHPGTQRRFYCQMGPSALCHITTKWGRALSCCIRQRSAFYGKRQIEVGE